MIAPSTHRPQTHASFVLTAEALRHQEEASQSGRAAASRLYSNRAAALIKLHAAAAAAAAAAVAAPNHTHAPHPPTAISAASIVGRERDTSAAPTTTTTTTSSAAFLASQDADCAVQLDPTFSKVRFDPRRMTPDVCIVGYWCTDRVPATPARPCGLLRRRP